MYYLNLICLVGDRVCVSSVEFVFDLVIDIGLLLENFKVLKWLCCKLKMVCDFLIGSC